MFHGFAAATLLLALAAPPREPAVSPAQLREGLALLAKTGALSAREHDKLAARLGEPSPAPAARSGCATALLMNARRWAAAQGAELTRSTLPYVGFLDSARYPVRVHYQTEALAGRAAEVLSHFEDAWRIQVDELGFRAPWTVAGDDSVLPGLHAFVVESYQYAGFTEPLADVRATPRCDCAVRVVVNSEERLRNLAGTVHHEFNHALQAATDCAESTSAWEGFATAVEFALGGRSNDFALEMVREFQRYPEYPLDYVTLGAGEPGAPTDLYGYGALLFPLYLVDRFGQGDLRMLREVWESFGQDGTMTLDAFGMRCSAGNEPDWFEGVGSVLFPRGATFDDAFGEFSTWRAAVGEHDDGAHFAAGDLLPPPALLRSHEGAPPFAGAGKLHAYGSRYVAVDAAALPAAVRVEVSADPLARWAASALVWREGLPVHRVELDFEGGEGRALVPTLGATAFRLVVSEIAGSAHTPDAIDLSKSAFEYRVLAEEPRESCATAPGAPSLAVLLVGWACACRRRGRPRRCRRN